MDIGRRFGGTSRTDSPSMSTSPSLGLSKPAIMRSVVVFPQPDGPSSVTKAPGSTSSEKPSTARRSGCRGL